MITSRFARSTFAAAALLSVALLVSCGGGGGGSGGDGRTTDTALRLIHGSIDGAPLALRIGTVVLQKARYLDITNFVPVMPGASTITVERANSTGVVISNIPTQLAEETEYTVFVTGYARDGSQHAALLPEPVQQPESGFGRVRLLNALTGSSTVSMRGAGVDTGAVREGDGSAFIDLPAGPVSLTLADSRGRQIGTAQFVMPDRGEMTVVAGGDTELGLVFTKLYPDLD